MTAASNRRLYLIAAVAIATITSGYATWRYVDGVVPGDGVFRLYGHRHGHSRRLMACDGPSDTFNSKTKFDHGMLVWLTFPFLAVYHMYSAHGWRDS